MAITLIDIESSGGSQIATGHYSGTVTGPSTLIFAHGLSVSPKVVTVVPHDANAGKWIISGGAGYRVEWDATNIYVRTNGTTTVSSLDLYWIAILS